MVYRLFSFLLVGMLLFASSAQADSGGVYPGQPAPPVPKETVNNGATTPGQKPPVKPKPKPPVNPVWSLSLLPDGKADFSPGAPVLIQRMVQAANRIIGKPYLWGGGHLKWEDKGYDCSGAVGYLLYGAGLITESVVSGELMTWGLPGKGRWVTIYTHRTHVFIHIANLRLDTSWVDDARRLHGVRWRPLRSQIKGFVLRHPSGL